MSQVFHLRGGRRGTTGLIDAWCHQHDVRAVTCTDAYEACVHLLRQAEPAPLVAFLGTDWLGRDEWAIVDYARATWPRTALVLYGSAAAWPGLSLPELAVCCPTVTTLRQLLAHPPAELVEHVRQAGRHPAPPPRPAAPAPSVGPLADLAISDPPAALLTREELAALLGED